MNPMQSPSTGPGGSQFGNRDRYMFRVAYTIPPLRSIKWAEFEEFGIGTEALTQMVKQDNPSWKIIKIERGIKQNESTK